MKTKNKYISIFGIIAFTGAISPIKVTYEVYSTGKVFSEKEWVLGRTEDGRITSTIKNNRLGVTSSYGGKEFARGDIFDFYMDPDLEHKKFVKQGEKIGLLKSSDINRQLTQLEGELKVEKAMLGVYSTGQKSQIISEAANNVMLAKETFNIKKKLYDRTQKLFSDSLIAPQNFDIVYNEYEISRINLDVAQARLQAVSTGEKPEQLKFSTEKILSLENQIKNLRERIASLEIVSPFSGVMQHRRGGTVSFLVPVPAMEILANVIDTSRFIIVSPVQLKELKYISIGQKVSLRLYNADCIMEGTVDHIDNGIQIINGKQAVYVISSIDKKCGDFQSGILAQTSFQGDKLTLFQYASRFVKGLFYR